jgi:hypothetical protein
MSESEAHKPDSDRTTRERRKSDVLDAARPLPPDEDVLINDLTEDEDRLFLAAVLSAWAQAPVVPPSSTPECSARD